jgi:hypothetical protein
LSASSLSIGRDRQTAPFSKSDCGLEQRVEVSPTAQAKTSAAEAAYFGWIGGFNSDFFSIKPASPPVEKGSAELADAAKSDRLAPQASSANTTVGSARENSKRGVQTTDPLLTKQAKRGPQAAAVEHTKVLSKPAPVPETRPTTIEGWTLLEVKGGTAVFVVAPERPDTVTSFRELR